MWYQSPADVWQTVLAGAVMFAGLLTAIRLVGNRAISTMNASDFIVTVAMGTTVASTMLSQSVTVAAGLTALASLVGVQAFTIWLSVRFPKVRQTAEGEPELLVRDGELLRERLLRTNVSEAEIRQAIREKGYGEVDAIAAVILEPNGRFSVIPREEAGDRSALEDPRETMIRESRSAQES